MKFLCKLFNHPFGWNHFTLNGYEIRVCKCCGKTQALRFILDGSYWVSPVQRTQKGFEDFCKESKIEIKD